MTTILLLLIIFMVKLIQRFYNFTHKKKNLIKYKISCFKRNPIKIIFNLVLKLFSGIVLIWLIYQFSNWGYTLGYDGFLNLCISIFYNSPFKLLKLLNEFYFSILDFYITTCNKAYIQPPQPPVLVNAEETNPYYTNTSKITKYMMLPVLGLNIYIALTFYVPVASELAIVYTCCRGGFFLLKEGIYYLDAIQYNKDAEAYNAYLLNEYQKALGVYNFQKAAEMPEPMEEFC